MEFNLVGFAEETTHLTWLYTHPHEEAENISPGNSCYVSWQEILNTIIPL